MDAMPTKPAVDGLEAAGATTPMQRFFRLIFTRHAMYMALLLVLPVVLADGFNASLTLLRDPDLWWHLADGRLLFTTGHFIHFEPYSFTVAGQPWINPEWLAEVPYWLSYRVLGLRGIYLVTLLAIAANIVLVYWRGFFNSRNAESAFWAGALAFVLMAVNIGPRMIVLGYIALSVEMLILEAAERGHRRCLWLLPLVFCIWINTHGTWFIGMALLVLYCAAGWFRVQVGAIAQDAMLRADRNRLLAVLAASLAALFVNPYGWRLVWNPFDMMLNQKLNIASVAEWKPLNVGSYEGGCLVAVVAIMILANLKRGRTWKLFDFAAVFFAFYAAVDHVRFLFLAAVVVTPILAVDLARSFSAKPNPKTIPAMNALIAACVLGYIAYMFPSEARLEKSLESEFPLETIRAIQPTWRTFNWDTLGGMMDFQSKSSFVDSRVDTFEHHGVFGNYMAAMNLVDAFEVLDYYKIDHALVAERLPITYLLNHSSDWRLVKQESAGPSRFFLFARQPEAVTPRPADSIKSSSAARH